MLIRTWSGDISVDLPWPNWLPWTPPTLCSHNPPLRFSLWDQFLSRSPLRRLASTQPRTTWPQPFLFLSFLLSLCRSCSHHLPRHQHLNSCKLLTIPLLSCGSPTHFILLVVGLWNTCTQHPTLPDGSYNLKDATTEQQFATSIQSPESADLLTDR